MTRRYDADAVTRALVIVDLTDPERGPHALQILASLIAEAASSLWKETAVSIRRAPPIVDVADNYDRLGYAPDAVARDARYSRYVDERRMLRSHTSAMIPALLRELAAAHARTDDAVDVAWACPGIVYRRDCIDRLHSGEPHQLDLWRIRRDGRYGELGPADLESMIVAVTRALLPGSEIRMEPRIHPYTQHGLQVDVRAGDEWIEILECGVAHPEVLRVAGLDPKEWSGLAMGMGLDRLLMLKKQVPDIRLLRAIDVRIASQMDDLRPYVPVSSMPPIRRDLSVVVADGDAAEEIGDRVRGALGHDAGVVEEVSIQSETSHDELPEAARRRLGIRRGQKNLLVRVVLRDPSRTLTHDEANGLRDRIYAAIHQGTEHEWAQARGRGP
ncbi:MAG: hypothetical protein HOW73_10235 [Polyangiaceae bacterium]|nr:hypothetical protein [Polyangiaceae bacterium]